jgi:hypothetical protein
MRAEPLAHRLARASTKSAVMRRTMAAQRDGRPHLVQFSPQGLIAGR